MFGKNALVKQDLTVTDSLKVVEVFPTIQGEGPFAGEPAIFIRLAGCNLKCYFCDTDFESNAQVIPHDDMLKIIADLRSEIKTDLIVITGGEPMLQNLLPLLNRLIPDYRVQIETAGTVWIDGLESMLRYADGSWQRLFLVCSPKTGKVHDMIQRYCNDWKYITIDGQESPDDGLPLYSTQVLRKETALARPTFVEPRIYLQPCDEHDEERNDANLKTTVDLAKKYGYRVCLQQHKYMGVD